MTSSTYLAVEYVRESEDLQLVLEVLEHADGGALRGHDAHAHTAVV